MKLHLPSKLGTLHLPHYGERPTPFRDWLLLISICSILLIASITWNTLFFIKATTGELVLEAPVTQKEPEITLIERVHTLFAAREAEEKRYRTEYTFIDPSK
jgi:hypothetical protein